ncbi:MAG: DNA polymerase III subunit delta [Mediterranea massiliensis]|nr:DNA polymerase III subunit delta [Mediterranea massiliensis]
MSFSFNDIIGQEAIKKQMTEEVQKGETPHALMLCGPAGAGKLPLALALARYICCPHRTADDACGTCPSCIKWTKMVHPDVHFMYPTIKNKLCDELLPDWRKMLLKNPYISWNQYLGQIGAENSQAIIYAKESDEMSRKLNMKPFEGGYKIAIIWMPEKMNESCANKMLKLLEEPPGKTIFLLVSQESEKVLPTILSRTRCYRIPPVGEQDMIQALVVKYGMTLEDSKTIGHLAAGSVFKALENIHLNEESQLFFDCFVKLMRLSYARRIKEMKQWSEELATMGRERQKAFLEYAGRMTRENFIYNLHRPEMNYMNREEGTFATRFAPFVNERNVFGIMNELEQAQLHIEQNVNARMVFFDLALKMIVLLKQ